MHDITTIIAFLLYIYIYMFINYALQPYTGTAKAPGAYVPTVWCEKSEHFHKCGTPNL